TPIGRAAGPDFHSACEARICSWCWSSDPNGPNLFHKKLRPPVFIFALAHITLDAVLHSALREAQPPLENCGNAHFRRAVRFPRAWSVLRGYTPRRCLSSSFTVVILRSPSHSLIGSSQSSTL